jgi:outer membrane biosynthesis protein TonB
VTGTRRSRLRWTCLAGLAGLACAAAVIVGCGSGAQPRLDSADATKLRAELASAASASAAGDRATTLAALDRFRARVDRLAATDRLASADARALRTGASLALAAAARQLPAPAPPAPAVVTSAAEPPPPPAPAHPAHPKPAPEHKHHHQPDKGKKGSD